MNFEAKLSMQSAGGSVVGSSPLFEIRMVERVFARGAGVSIDCLDIPSGCVFAILGATGSGKSTLLNLLGGLEPPKARAPDAKLIFNPPSSKPVDLMKGLGLGAALSNVGFVFQSGHLMRDATVSANLAVSRAAARLPIDGTSIEALCHSLRLRTGIASDRARILSGGEAQRVAVGRALLRDPDVVLADEPTASLDPAFGTQVMAALSAWQLAARQRRALIWVTHNYEEAAKFADRVIVLRGGRLCPGFEEPCDNPRDPRVLQTWVDGYDGVEPDSATVARIKAEAAEALDGYALRSEGTSCRAKPVRWPRLALAGKLAASELLSNPLIDSDDPPRRWLERLTAFSRNAPNISGATAFMRDAIGPRLAVVASAGALAIVAESDRLPASYAMFALLTAIIGAVAAILWPVLQRAEGFGQVIIYTVLLMALAGLEQGTRVLDASYVRKMNTPELSHLVLNGSRISEQLTPHRLAQIGCEMESRGIAPLVVGRSGEACEQRREIKAGAPFPPNNTIFGRWDTRGIAVARRTDRTSVEPDRACASAQSIGNFAAIVADPEEPVFRMIGSDVVPPDGNALIRVGNINLNRRANEDIPLIGASRAFVINALNFRDNVNRDPFICVKFKDWRVVRIAHVLDQLPSDGEAEYQMLFPPPLHFEALRQRYESPQVREQMTAAYDTVAIYLSPAMAAETLQYVAELASHNADTRAGLVAEPGFKKIKAAIDGWAISRGIARTAILGALALSSILIVVAMANRITENDKGLCVMRAFGMRFTDVFLFVWLQALIFFVTGGALGLLIVYLAWPGLAARVFGAFDVGTDSFPPGPVLLLSYSLFAAAMTISCLVATGLWWSRSKQIAQRLQRLA